MDHKLVLSVLSCLVLSSSAAVAPFIVPCKSTDEACLVSSSQAALSHVIPGIPALGVPSSDPLVLDNVKTNEGELNLEFKNLHVSGLAQSKFEAVTISPEKEVLTFKLQTPIKATGQYVVSGKLLIVPISGDGDFQIDTERVKLSVKAVLKKIDGSDGKQHYDIASYEYEYDLIEKFNFHLDNLFGGDQAKSDAVNKVLSESGNEVIKTFGKPIIDDLVAKAKNNINTLFHAIPAEEILLD